MHHREFIVIILNFWLIFKQYYSQIAQIWPTWSASATTSNDATATPKAIVQQFNDASTSCTFTIPPVIVIGLRNQQPIQNDPRVSTKFPPKLSTFQKDTFHGSKSTSSSYQFECIFRRWIFNVRSRFQRAFIPESELWNVRWTPVSIKNSTLHWQRVRELSIRHLRITIEHQILLTFIF